MSRMITRQLFHANPFLPFSSSCLSLSRFELRDTFLREIERQRKRENGIRAQRKRREESQGEKQREIVVLESLNCVVTQSFLVETFGRIYCRYFGRFRNRNAVPGYFFDGFLVFAPFLEVAIFKSVSKVLLQGLSGN